MTKMKLALTAVGVLAQLAALAALAALRARAAELTLTPLVSEAL